MAKKPSSVAKPAAAESEILSYRHPDRRKNNPEVGMVTPATDADDGKTAWRHDPHLDPSLSWTGKAERLSFEVDTVSLHVHERIDPASILSAARQKVGAGGTAKDKAKGAKAAQQRAMQPGLFDAPFESLPLRDAIDFYKHDKGWSNRLVAGDSLLVMNSLLQKESMAGQVQAIYFDPPYGIKYGSNFQPFVNKRDVKDRKDEDLTQEPEMIKAFRDTWELGIHSYLTYLRDRLLLAKELLSESGSVFVQISDENLHHVRELCDEVFGTENLVSQITFQKTSSASGEALSSVSDYLVWYAKKRESLKFRQLYLPRAGEGWVNYDYLRTAAGEFRRMSTAERSDWKAVPVGSAIYRRDNLTSQRPAQANDVRQFDFMGTAYDPGKGTFKTDANGLRRLASGSRLEAYGRTLAYRRFADDFPFFPYNNLWTDTLTGGFVEDRYYVVQTTQKVIERCLLMTTDPGDLVLDPTCGSGTTAFVAEKWGRRWITCDTSRVAVTLAKQRLMTASYDYYELRYPHEGLRGGFIWKTVPHVTLKSIANNPDIDAIYERMHPAIEQALAELNKALKAEAKEWEVPFDFPGGSDKARAAFDAFHAARQAMQKAMDRSIADHADQETLYDQPAKSKTKLRITGPFSVEAVPFPTVQALDDESRRSQDGAQLGTWSADASIARSGESSRQHQWRDELLKTGIRGKGGQMLRFAELETLPGTKYLHGTGHTEDGQRVVVHFGPEHAALEQRAVTNALEEAGNLFPLPKMIVFCAFAFDPEAAKDIDHLKGCLLYTSRCV